METFVTLEEHIGLHETIQGNVNVAGLVWDHEVQEELGLGDGIYIVWVDQVESALETGDTIDEPYHRVELAETLLLQEVMGGIPVEVYQSNVNLVCSGEAAPVRVWWVGLNVVHGPDTFFEEVVSNCHMRVTYTQAVPYYFRHVYESLNLEFHNIQPHPGLHVALHMTSNDLLNMRHQVIQEYRFNSLSDEKLFTYDKQAWGWRHDIEDGAVFNASLYEIIGKVADEHIRFRDALKAEWQGHEKLNDTIFSWDRALHARGWSMALDEEVQVEDLARVYLDLLIQDHLIAEWMASGKKEFANLVKDQIALAEKMVNSFELQVVDSLDAEDEPLRRWLGMALIEEQASFDIEAGFNQQHEVEINVSMSLTDNN